jgi:hypothetical protein
MPLYLRSEDQMKAWRTLYRKKPVVKISRMRRLYQKIKEGNKKQEEDKRKGLQYTKADWQDHMQRKQMKRMRLRRAHK